LIKQWLASCGLPDLEVTNVKDLQMVELWDDRCVQVMTNMGEPVGKKSAFSHDRQRAMNGLGNPTESTGLLSRLKIFLTL
jgi:hypothetical protein